MQPPEEAVVPHGSRCHWLAQLPSARKSLSWPKTQTLYSPAPGPHLPNLQLAVTPRQTIQILSRLSLPTLGSLTERYIGSKTLTVKEMVQNQNSTGSIYKLLYANIVYIQYQYCLLK